MVHKLPIVGVFGSGSPIDADRAHLALGIGAMVASLGAHLLTGGGYGVMEAVAEGYVASPDRAGLSIGIVPRRPDGAFDEPIRNSDGRAYPNDFVEIAIRTPLPPRTDDWCAMPARNHINVLTADAIVSLPGGPGTANELEMAAAYRDEKSRPPADRRTILVGPRDEFTLAQREMFVHSADIAEAAALLRRILSARGAA
jgi:uncharacterized protein (TIGR00725 family)